MAGGFNNPLVASGGSLVYPSIHSPNYVLNVTGWSINKDGTAQFTGLVLIGGTFTGSNFIMNSAGEFFYSGTPAANNLIGSNTNAAGTDQFGNAYLQGNATYQLGISNWTAIAMQSITGGAQIAWYYTPGLTETGWISGGNLSFAPGVASPSGTPLQYQANGQGLIIGASAIEPVGLNGYIQFGGQAAPSNKTGFIALYANPSATALAYVGGDGQNINLMAGGAANQSSFTITSATAQQATNAWPINSGDAQNGTTYRLTFIGKGTQGSTPQSLVAQFSNGNAAAAIGSGFAGASSAFFFKCVLEVTQVSPTTANYFCWFSAGTGFASGLSQNVAFSTPFTLEGAMRWGSTTGAPTATSLQSYYERIGP